MKNSAKTKGESPSRLIDARIKELDDWRGKTFSCVRALIKQAEPEVVEEWKWRGVPVWSHWNDLHRRDVQERREADFLQGRFAQGPFRTIQLQP